MLRWIWLISVIFSLSNISAATTPFYDTPAVAAFRRDYLALNATLETRSVSIVIDKMAAGFGNLINNCFNFFLMAWHNKLPFHISFDLIAWGRWSDLFHDFTSSSPSPIILEADSQTQRHLYHNISLPYGLNNLYVPRCLCDLRNYVLPDTPNAYIHNPTRFHFTIGYHGKDWELAWHAPPLQTISFSEKQILLQAMWDPVPAIRHLVETIYTMYKANSLPGSAFMSVHIRQGDKVSSEEMRTFPINQWVNKLYAVHYNYHNPTDPKTFKLKTILNNTSHHHTTVFLFSDSQQAIADFKRLIDNSSFTVITLPEAIDEVLSRVHRGEVLFHHYNGKSLRALQNLQRRYSTHHRNGYFQGLFQELPIDERMFWLKDLVTSLTLASLGDAAVCTYSSNICRVLTLLLPAGMSVVHSVDEPAWQPIR